MNENTFKKMTGLTDQIMPDTLYHYCGVSGFYGIITNNNLWLTDIYFMNDYMEHVWLIEKAYKRLCEMRKTCDKESIKSLLDRFPVGFPPYICCFTSEPDLLSQWRAYSDDGAGFAIGFSRKVLEEQISHHTRDGIRILLSKVEYDENEQCRNLDVIWTFAN